MAPTPLKLRPYGAIQICLLLLLLLLQLFKNNCDRLPERHEYLSMLAAGSRGVGGLGANVPDLAVGGLSTREVHGSVDGRSHTDSDL